MRSTFLATACGVVLVAFAQPGFTDEVQWPHVTSPVPANPQIEAKIAALLKQMTLEQKVGQMVQAEIRDATPDDVRKYRLGSVLNGGGAFPGNNKHATVADWVALADKFYDASMDTSDRKSTRLNSSHNRESRMPSSA